MFRNNKHFFKYFKNKWPIFFVFMFACFQLNIFPMDNIEQKPAQIAIFIKRERAYKKDPISKYFYQAIKKAQNTALIIFGTYMIYDGFEDIEKSLKQWHIFGIHFKSNQQIFAILIPQESNNPYQDLARYDISLPTEHFNHTYFKEVSRDNIAGLYDKDIESKDVPDIIEKLFSNKLPKIVWIAGHGKAYEEEIKCTIADLTIKDTQRLLTALEKNRVEVTWMTSCFFGGKNLKAIQDYLNAQNAKMIVFSQATAEVQTYFSYVDFPQFFSKCAKYLNLIHSSSCSSNELDDYVRNEIIPPLLNAKENTYDLDTYEQSTRSMATVRNPSGDYQHNYFHSLASMVIDSELIKKHIASKEPIVVNNQAVLFIDVQNVTVPIIIKGQTPIIVFAEHKFDEFSFETITMAELLIDDTNIGYFFGMIMGRDINFYGYNPRNSRFSIKKLIFSANQKEFSNVSIKRINKNDYEQIAKVQIGDKTPFDVTIAFDNPYKQHYDSF